MHTNIFQKDKLFKKGKLKAYFRKKDKKTYQYIVNKCNAKSSCVPNPLSLFSC